jgi:hypothetical protein
VSIPQYTQIASPNRIELFDAFRSTKRLSLSLDTGVDTDDDTDVDTATDAIEVILR